MDAFEFALYATRSLMLGCNTHMSLPGCSRASELLEDTERRAQTLSPASASSAADFFKAIAEKVDADATSNLGAAAASMASADVHASRLMERPPLPSAKFSLNDGTELPRIGIGTWLTTGEACYDMVVAALKAGFRHIDTSENYQNHQVAPSND